MNFVGLGRGWLGFFLKWSTKETAAKIKVTISIKVLCWGVVGHGRGSVSEGSCVSVCRGKVPIGPKGVMLRGPGMCGSNCGVMV